MNRKLYSCGIFIDLKRAFDRVDVKIMSLKSATKARKTISIFARQGHFYLSKLCTTYITVTASLWCLTLHKEVSVCLQ